MEPKFNIYCCRCEDGDYLGHFYRDEVDAAISEHLAENHPSDPKDELIRDLLKESADPAVHARAKALGIVPR